MEYYRKGLARNHTILYKKYLKVSKHIYPLKEIIPSIIYYLFSYSVCGFQNAATIRAMNTNDISHINMFVKTIPQIINNILKKKGLCLEHIEIAELDKYFLGPFPRYRSFKLDSVVEDLLMNIITYVNSKIGSVKSNTLDVAYFYDFSYFSRRKLKENPGLISKTVIGELFSCK